MDAVDLAILHKLRDRGRLALSGLSEAVHASRTSVHGRLKRLHDDGVITGYHAAFDPKRVGLQLAALILIGVDQTRLVELRETLDTIPEIEMWGLTLGEYDGFVYVRVGHNDDLRDLIVHRIRDIPGVTKTMTILVIDESPYRQALPATLPS